MTFNPDIASIILNALPFLIILFALSLAYGKKNR